MTPVMPNTTYEEISVVNAGVNLFLRSWRPGQPAGVVFIVPGFNSHSGYYGWTAEQLVAGGLSV